MSCTLHKIQWKDALGNVWNDVVVKPVLDAMIGNPNVTIVKNEEIEV